MDAAYCAAVVVPRSLAPASVRILGIAAPVAGSNG